jgi:hypothetical protein
VLAESEALWSFSCLFFDLQARKLLIFDVKECEAETLKRPEPDMDMDMPFVKR